MTIAELRAYLGEYAQRFDARLIDSERFLAWLAARTAMTQSEAETVAEAQEAIALMTPSGDAPLQSLVALASTTPVESLVGLWDGSLVPAPDAYQASSQPAAEGANA